MGRRASIAKIAGEDLIFANTIKIGRNVEIVPE
jgi:hypothetical protein